MTETETMALKHQAMMEEAGGLIERQKEGPNMIDDDPSQLMCDECANVYDVLPFKLEVDAGWTQYYCSWECLAAWSLQVCMTADNDDPTGRTDHVLAGIEDFLRWANG